MTPTEPGGDDVSHHREGTVPMSDPIPPFEVSLTRAAAARLAAGPRLSDLGLDVVRVGLMRVPGGYGLSADLAAAPPAGLSLPREVDGVPVFYDWEAAETSLRRDPAHFDTPRNRLLLALSAAGLAARRAAAAVVRGIVGATTPRRRG